MAIVIWLKICIRSMMSMSSTYYSSPDLSNLAYGQTPVFIPVRYDSSSSVHVLCAPVCTVGLYRASMAGGSPHIAGVGNCKNHILGNCYYISLILSSSSSTTSLMSSVHISHFSTFFFQTSTSMSQFQHVNIFCVNIKTSFSRSCKLIDDAADVISVHLSFFHFFFQTGTSVSPFSAC